MQTALLACLRRHGIAVVLLLHCCVSHSTALVREESGHRARATSIVSDTRLALGLGAEAEGPDPLDSWGKGTSKTNGAEDDVEPAPSHVLPKHEDHRTTVIVSSLMLAFVACMVSLLYLLKSSDEDIPYYALRTMDLSVSLFTALVLFSAVQRCITEYITGGHAPPVWIQILHMLFWFLIMQLLAAIFSGAILTKELPEPDPGRPDAEGVKVKDQWRERRLQIKCWAGMTTHLTAIAAMTALGTLQEMPFFAKNPLTALLVVPIGFAATVLLYQGGNYLRYYIAMSDDGELDFAEVMWDEEAKAGEDEVCSLSLSFVTLQAYSFWMVGRGPRSLASDTPIKIDEGSWGEVCGLLAFAVVCVGVTILFARSKEALERRWRSNPRDGSAPILRSKSHLISDNHSFVLRCVGIGTSYMMMCLAWSLLMAIKEATRLVFPELARDGIVMKITIALTTTFITFAVILVLDKIADHNVAGGETERVIVTIINANSFLIGFSWEVCFSKALIAIGGPHGSISGLTHLGLSLVVCVVVIPAYRWYLLPERHTLGQQLANMNKGISKLCDEEIDPEQFRAHVNSPTRGGSRRATRDNGLAAAIEKVERAISRADTAEKAAEQQLT